MPTDARVDSRRATVERIRPFSSIHPAVQLEVGSADAEKAQVPLVAPDREQAQVGGVATPGAVAVAGEEAGDGDRLRPHESSTRTTAKLVTSRKRPAIPIPVRRCATTEAGDHSIATPPTSSRRSSPAPPADRYGRRYRAPVTLGRAGSRAAFHPCRPRRPSARVPRLGTIPGRVPCW